MGVASPTSSRVEERDDQLVVYFWPRRKVVFLGIFLIIWTSIGLGMLPDITRDEGPGPSLIFWFGWALGGCAVIFALAWELFGRTMLVITRDRLDLQRNIGPFVRTNRHAAALVRDVRAARVPSGEDEPKRKDFGLELSYDADTVHVGEGMDEREADWVAELVRSRIGLKRRPPEETADAQATVDRNWQWLVRSAAFPLLVIAALVWIALQSH